MRAGASDVQLPGCIADLIDHPLEAFRRAGEEFVQQIGDRAGLGVDGDCGFAAVAPEERRDVGEAGFLKHPHHGGAQLAAAEHGIRARAVEQRVFDRQRDILRHIAGFAQARRQKTVDQSGLQSDRIEYGPAAVELLNQNCPFRQFYHKVPRVIIHYYYNLAPEPPISNPAPEKNRAQPWKNSRRAAIFRTPAP